MKEINIAKVIITKRKEKGVTQDELAEYMGVSKASVSKWETGQSYPDITFLPQLATYFNISIDELMGYSPQMTRDDIRKLYQDLTSQFTSETFDQVIAECRMIIKKYYSCFPLLMQMVIFYANHYTYASEPKHKEEILHEAVELCIRIRTESEDIWLSKQALYMQAFLSLSLNEPQSVLDLLGDAIRPELPAEALISNAYMLKGNSGKAKEVTQISIYQHLIISLDALLNYLLLCSDNMCKAEEILNRCFSLSETFNLEKLNPNKVVQLYAAGAGIYCMNGFNEKALDLLAKCFDVCINKFFPYKLHGDEFFDSIDHWLSELDLGIDAPRSEEVIKESMLRDILLNPAFSVLQDLPRFKSILQKFKSYMEETKQTHT